MMIIKFILPITFGTNKKVEYAPIKLFFLYLKLIKLY